MLDSNGVVTEGAESPLTIEQTLEALRLMMLGRAFDTKCFSLQRQGKLGTFAPLHGQEASIVGSAMALNPETDWIAPQYREMPAAIRQGLPLENIILYRQGHPAGGVVPTGVNVMQFQISLAAQIPHAVGLAWGMQLQQKNGVSIAYFGEGSSSEGDFHEACNLAGVTKAPVIFLLQNNQWAISTPREIQSATVDFATRAPGYGFPGVSVDGNDLFAVYQAVAEAVARGRNGGGPTLIECHTYRMWAHTTADDPTRYVNEAVEKAWALRDPIDRVQKYLASQSMWDEEKAAEWEQEITAEIQAGFDKAATVPPPGPADLYEHVFATPTESLLRQRRAHLQET
ncbi:pyruvate dehydrogenase (acetyl-transferring) E1 component subunit alpha [Chromatiales bacterium (ex Bugula neritina AB1)]|nr:pyruvate dehydrogenase (acetyl-transferring) E1 component subunit alpha [Chromatiales bacterium (ex Bugula neritina AB1)]